MDGSGPGISEERIAHLNLQEMTTISFPLQSNINNFQLVM
jgi:hypothetical protein